MRGEDSDLKESYMKQVSREALPSVREGGIRIDSATLTRLVEEVRNGADFAPNAYNRVHNRHNR